MPILNIEVSRQATLSHCLQTRRPRRASIDYEGPNAFTAVIHGIIGYEPEFGKKHEWKAGIGFEMPANSFTNATGTATVSQRVPDIPFYIQRNWAGGAGWLRISGIIRNLYYRNDAAGRNIDKIGWGIKASGTTPIIGGLSAYYQAVYGKRDCKLHPRPHRMRNGPYAGSCQPGGA